MLLLFVCLLFCLVSKKKSICKAISTCRSVLFTSPPLSSRLTVRSVNQNVCLSLWVWLLVGLDVLCEADRWGSVFAIGAHSKPGALASKGLQLQRETTSVVWTHTCVHTDAHTQILRHFMWCIFVIYISFYLRLRGQVQTCWDIKLIHWSTLEDRVLWFPVCPTLKPFSSENYKGDLFYFEHLLLSQFIISKPDGNPVQTDHIPVCETSGTR